MLLFRLVSLLFLVPSALPVQAGKVSGDQKTGDHDMDLDPGDSLNR